MYYRFEVDGRAAGPFRETKGEAIQDCVNAGCGVWVDENTAKIDSNMGAEIAAHEYIGNLMA